MRADRRDARRRAAPRITETGPSRDHTERILRRSRVPFERDGLTMTVSQVDELELDEIVVPGDPSSAAFIVAAACLVPGSRVVVSRRRAQLDPHRLLPDRPADGRGDPGRPRGAGHRRRPTSRWATSTWRYGPLEGTAVEPDEVPLAIDELTLVALLGAFAEGETVVRGGRASCASRSPTGSPAWSRACAALGADIEDTGDGFVVRGDGEPLRGRGPRRARRPPPGHARRRRRPGLDARAWRSWGWRRRRSPIRASRRTWRRCSAGCLGHASLRAMVVAIDGPAGRARARSRARRRERSASPTSTRAPCTARWPWPLLEDGGAASERARELEIELGERVVANGRDVTEAIRTPEVSEAASRIAADEKVRAALVEKQRALLARGDWVAEGRDIGTVVAPDAAVKVFLTAERGRARAAPRRGARRGPRRPSCATRRCATRRTRSREHSPLRAAPTTPWSSTPPACPSSRWWSGSQPWSTTSRSP